jgi:hypothetical protein
MRRLESWEPANNLTFHGCRRIPEGFGTWEAAACTNDDEGDIMKRGNKRQERHVEGTVAQRPSLWRPERSAGCRLRELPERTPIVMLRSLLLSRLMPAPSGFAPSLDALCTGEQ